MKSRCWLYGFLLALIAGATSGTLLADDAAASGAAAMWQNMPLIALLNGYMAGNVTVQEALAHGDFGLGAFADLDGEMVAVGGKVYQIRADGVAKQREGQVRLSYAQMVNFHGGDNISLPKGTTMETILQALARRTPTKNSTYAVRITGSFSKLKTRAPRKQDSPYPAFCEAVKTQELFNLDGQTVTMVGFIAPAYLASVDSAGVHLHALTQSGKAGGHVLEFTANQATAEVQRIDRIIIDAPQDRQFDSVSLSVARTCP